MCSTALCACSTSFLEREELPHVRRVGSTGHSLFKYLYSMYSDMIRYHCIIIGENLIWRFFNDPSNHKIKVLTKIFSLYGISNPF